MQAERWANDRSFPCDAEYGRAEDLTAPLLEAAGNLLGRRLRLCRPRQTGSARLEAPWNALRAA